jgi:para-aminobenzoate synthetase
MKTLLIDNYDSYSHILADYIWRCSDHKPVVIKNDSLSLEEIKYLEFDNIIISPGLGHPDKPDDFGVSRELMNYFNNVPILGVCLGHQGMGSVFGLKVTHAPKVMHGKYSDVKLARNELFKDMNDTIKVVGTTP